ncbi:fimbrial protein [Hafnia alvei]|uniref:fimbrial protein n=1 Tax=Hafnia alvei TaxID=569 RepID=UPI001412CF51|nr:fimbrial protein [Hafnia alvei]QIP56116.1 fimbrial protein [Hafnia alvei]
MNSHHCKNDCRNINRRSGMIFMVFLSLLGVQKIAFAGGTCGASSIHPVQNFTVPLGSSITAGNDLPIGTVLYRVNVFNNGIVGMKCQTDAQGITAPGYFKVSVQPSGGPYTQSGLPYTGQIYNTNVPGIGVAMLYTSNNTFTSSSPIFDINWVIGPNTASGEPSRGIGFFMSLIKTGPIAPGAQVLGSSLPTAIYYVDSTPGVTGLPFTMLTANFSGTVAVMNATCETPDVNVNLGTFDNAITFRSKGTTTPWVDASIVLDKCPTFSGYYGTGTQTAIGGIAPSGGALTSNKVVLSLTPNTPIIDGPNGIISVNAANTDDSAATGVGIQIGYGSITSPTKWSFPNTWTVNAPTTGQSFKIPLAARYYQTGDYVTPGPADAQVTFTINYN